jgi:hypothetical protein
MPTGYGRKEKHTAFLTVLLTLCGYHESRGAPEKRTDSGIVNFDFSLDELSPLNHQVRLSREQFSRDILGWFPTFRLNSVQLTLQLLLS